MMTFCPNNLLNSIAISGTFDVSAMSSKVSSIVLEVFLCISIIVFIQQYHLIPDTYFSLTISDLAVIYFSAVSRAA